MPSPRILLALVAGVALALSACASEDVDDAIDDAESLTSEAADTAEANADEISAASTPVAEELRAAGLTNAASLVEAIDFEQVVGTDEFTFFAPNDDAFLELTADELADLLADPERVVAVLRDHTLDETLDAAGITERGSVTTVAGTELPITTDGDQAMIGDATIVTPGITVGDGVVHVIDAVLTL